MVWAIIVRYMYDNKRKLGLVKKCLFYINTILITLNNVLLRQ